MLFDKTSKYFQDLKNNISDKLSFDKRIAQSLVRKVANIIIQNV